MKGAVGDGMDRRAYLPVQRPACSTPDCVRRPQYRGDLGVLCGPCFRAERREQEACSMPAPPRPVAAVAIEPSPSIPEESPMPTPTADPCRLPGCNNAGQPIVARGLHQQCYDIARRTGVLDEVALPPTNRGGRRAKGAQEIVQEASTMVAAARDRRGQANLPTKESHRVSVEQEPPGSAEERATTVPPDPIEPALAKIEELARERAELEAELGRVRSRLRSPAVLSAPEIRARAEALEALEALPTLEDLRAIVDGDPDRRLPRGAWAQLEGALSARRAQLEAGAFRGLSLVLTRRVVKR